MDGALFERICGWFTGPQALWSAVWIGLGGLTVFLVVLTYTRWGLSHSIEKCMVLSMLAHVLLAVAATTVQVQLASGWTPLVGPGDPLAVAITDDPGEATGDRPDGGGPSAQQPWERSDESVAPLAPDKLERLAPDAPDLIREAGDVPSTPAVDPPTAIEAPRPELADEADHAPTNAPRRAAEPIETVAATQRVEPAVTDPPNGSPGRPEGATADVTPIERSGAVVDPAALPSDFPTIPKPDVVAGVGDDEPRAVSVKAAPAAVADGSSNGSSAGSRGGAGGGEIIRPGGGKLPSVYGGRFSPDRVKSAGNRGATGDTEAAVAAALEYLARNQSVDGHWDPIRLEGGREDGTAGHDRQGAGIGADSGITGLALLAFLGAGHTHLDGKYKDNVRRGLEYLLSLQKPDGNLSGGARFFAEMYCHAMANCALSESYAVTGDRRLAAAVERGIEFTVQAQNPTTGGWRYQTWRKAPDDPGDMSQHGWQVLALKSAELAGIRVPDAVKSRAMRFVTSSSSGEHGGKAAYRPREQATTTMTAEAWVCREFLGMSRSQSQAAEAARFIAGEPPGGKTTNFYYLYYGTLAMYQVGGDYWNAWNDALRPTLVRSQRTDGALAGSWDPDPIWGGYGGRAFSTALGAMCLEVYYRYLPLYAQE